MIEYVLYATKKKAEDWEEEVIAVDTKPATPEEMAAIVNVLNRKGYNRIRVARIDLSKPPQFGRNVLNI